MANLADIVTKKNQKDQEWKVQRQADRDNAVAMQDAGIVQIVTDPEMYRRYLQMQGDNPMYSVGNLALSLFQKPEFTQIGTRERWKATGRFVPDSETDKGVQIFVRSTFGRGYVLSEAYDIAQTTGREMAPVKIENDTKESAAALNTLLNYSAVPVTVEENLDCAAYYDPERMELAINPSYPDDEAFAAIAAEVAHSRFHNKGYNQQYDRAESHLDAESVSCILCTRFGIKREMPDTSRLAELYGGWTPQEARQALDAVQDMCKKIGGSIQRDITPQQHSRSSTRKPVR